MSVTAANINDLARYVRREGRATQTVGEEFNSTATLQAAVFSACVSAEGFQVPDSPGLVGLASLFEQWTGTTSWVNGVRTALIEADNVDLDGNATAPTSEITQFLDANNLDTEPTNIDIADVQLFGQPPYSGLIDDPINAATGNFTDTVIDLEMPGVTREITVARSYNSRAGDRAGAFGPGWWSLIDAHLDVETHLARFVLPDGGAATFDADGTGGFEPDHRHKMHLTALDDGWQVRRGFDATWTFAADGALVAADTSSTAVRFERDERTITVRELHSGRSVRYTRHADHARVIRVEASDGRSARYRYDDNGHLSTAERPAGDLRYDVDETGLITAMTDADGVLVCRNTYDRWGRVLTQVESHGRETTYEYGTTGVFKVTANDGAPPNVMVHDRRGRMTSMIDGLGNAMRLGYDDADNITRVVDRTGAATTHHHDESGNLIRRVDPDGLGVEIEYDEVSRPVVVTDRADNVWRFGYRDDHRVPTTIEQPNGASVQIEVDDRDLPVAIVDADDVTIGLTWSDDGQITAIVDAEGNRTTFVRDDAGNLVGQQDPAGVLTDIECDTAGRVLRAVGAMGEQTWGYTSAGRLVSATGLDGQRWVGHLDETGEVAAVETDPSSTLHYERDRIGQITGIVRGDVRIKTIEYDPTGRVVTDTDALGGRVARAYDAEGRMTAVTDAAGRTHLREVDVFGRTVRVTNPAGDTAERTYHPTGALASLTDADGSVWRYDVNFLGQCVTATDPLGNVTTCEYSPAGRLLRVTTPLGRVTTYDYDAAGRCRSVEHSNGRRTEYEYRADGQVETVVSSTDGVEHRTSVGYSDAGVLQSVGTGHGSASFAHDAAGLTAVDDRGAVSRIDHDAGGLLSRVLDPAGVETVFTHDQHGRMSGHRTGGSSIGFGYDEADRLREIVDAHGDITTITREGTGAVVGVDHPDGSSVRYVLGVDGRIEALRDGGDDLLVGFEHTPTGQVSSSTGDGGTTHYRRDPLGRIVEVEDPTGTLRYSWDADNRLQAFDDGNALRVELRHGPSGEITYTLDGVPVSAPAAPERTRDDHGRIVVDENGRSYEYDTAGRLRTSVAGTASHRFEYDASGLLTREDRPTGTVDYEYGAGGELLVLRSAVGEATYDYDERHRRIRERHPDGATTEYEWDALSRLRSFRRTAADGTVSERRFAYSTVSRPCRIDDTPIVWDAGRGGDLLGIGDQRFLWHGADVMLVGEDGGDWSRRLTDDPFGDDGDEGIRLGYRGALACDHLVLLGDRVYDPATRQFLTKDPLGPTVGRLDFAAPYNYCFGDPVNHVDPTGRKPLTDEEYETWQQNQNVFGRTKNFVKDNWQEIAIVVGAVALGALLTPLVGPIAAGAIAGAVGNGAISAVNGGSLGDIARSAAIGGITGAIGGGLAGRFANAGQAFGPSTAAGAGQRFAENALRQGALATPVAVGEEALDSYVDVPFLDDRPDRTFNTSNVVVNVTGNALGGGLVEQFKHQPGTDVSTPPPPDVMLPQAPDGFVRRPSGLLVPEQSGLITPGTPQLIVPSRQLIVPSQPQIMIPGAAQLSP